MWDFFALVIILAPMVVPSKTHGQIDQQTSETPRIIVEIGDGHKNIINLTGWTSCGKK